MAKKPGIQASARKGSQELHQVLNIFLTQIQGEQNLFLIVVWWKGFIESGIVMQDVLEGSELALVHVRRSFGCIAQSWSLKLSPIMITFPDRQKSLREHPRVGRRCISRLS